MARVLITGATGFIGRNLVKFLSEHDHAVTCLVRQTSNTAPLKRFSPGIAIGDVCEPESVTRAVAGQDVVIHLAGVTKCVSGSHMRRINIDGSKVVAQACATQSSPPTLVHVSSLAAAGPARNNRPLTEADTPAPVSSYGKSKLAGERAVAKFADRIPVAIVRPPIVFGEGDRDTFELFKRVMQNGIHLMPSGGNQRFSLIHAEDMALALELVACNGKRVSPGKPGSGVYFVSSAEAPTYAELGKTIGRLTGRTNIRCVKIPKFALRVIGGLCEVRSKINRKPFIMSWDKAREATGGAWWCSAEAISRDVGFQPMATLASRLAQSANWYVSQGWIRLPAQSDTAKAARHPQFPFGHSRQPQGR